VTLGEYLTVSEMIAVEMNSVYLGVSTQMLMETAGKSVANETAKRFKPGSKVVVVSGLSGNGGDGFVAARHLADMGYNVDVLVIGDPKDITLENTRVNYEALTKMTSSIELDIIKDSSLIPEIKADIIIDGLIGTSMQGPLRPPYLQMVQAINKPNAYRIAIDVPTGLVADTGVAHGECVQADLTVTFHKPKKGYITKPKQLGELVVAAIGIPPEAELYTGPGDVALVHPKRKEESHKGMHGSLLVVGGSETYSGAPALSAMAAYATGCDLIYVAVPETAANAVAGFSPSLITVKLDGKRFTPKNLDDVKPFLEKVDAVAMGPGLGQHDKTVEAFTQLHEIVQEKRLPTVVDADGLKAYAQTKPKIKAPLVFTPHGREFQLLTGKNVEGGFKDKGVIVEKAAKKLGAVVLLKGSVDVISDGKTTRYNWTGNPGMTVGGTGDVLTGLVGGYLAMGAEPFYTACASAFINGIAGDRVYNEKGYHILPEDIVNEIPFVVQDSIETRS
jgi:NAD(P)H-hydrate epimerase